MVILVPLGLALVPADLITDADSVTAVEPSSVMLLKRNLVENMVFYISSL